MDKELKDLVLGFIAEIVPKIEHYRAKNVNKYYRESEISYGADPQKLERYKNRTRLVDIFLPALKEVLLKEGVHTLEIKDEGGETPDEKVGRIL